MLIAPDLADSTAEERRAFIQSLSLILELFKEGMKKLLGVSEQQIQAVIEYVLAGLPVYLKRVLSAANGLAQATA